MKLFIHKILVYTFCISFLIGVSASEYSDIICIGEDGHIEFETVCLPCCTETDDFCQTEVVDFHHEDHAECSNCSDMDFDSPLWTKRLNNNDSKQLVLKDLSLFTYVNLSTIQVRYSGNNRYNTSHSIHSPSQNTISFTILIC